MSGVDIWEKYARYFISEETSIYPPDFREIDFYRQLRSEYQGACLEIGAGYGRLSRSLFMDSLTVALEPSGEMLSGWQSRDLALAARVMAEGQVIPFRSDSFEFAAFPYNGLQCIVDAEQRRQVFREAFRVLYPGGGFLIEVSSDRRAEEPAVERYTHTFENGTSLGLVEAVRRDVDLGTITYDMVYAGFDEEPERIVLVLALIDKDDLLRDLMDTGFSSLQVWGDYNRSVFTGRDSPRLLVLAGKGDVQ
jgi:SAM-dependent methyltransferase